jgi:hypothetical protein
MRQAATAAPPGLPTLPGKRRGGPNHPALLWRLGRAQEFARHPVSDGTLPPDDRAEQRKAALPLAQECGRAVAHCCLAFMELQAGGWEE